MANGFASVISRPDPCPALVRALVRSCRAGRPYFRAAEADVHALARRRGLDRGPAGHRDRARASPRFDPTPREILRPNDPSPSTLAFDAGFRTATAPPVADGTALPPPPGSHSSSAAVPSDIFSPGTNHSVHITSFLLVFRVDPVPEHDLVGRCFLRDHRLIVASPSPSSRRKVKMGGPVHAVPLAGKQ